MEANVVDAEFVDQFVRTGQGTVEEALRHLFLVWQTEEVRDLLAWMRAYNADPSHRKKLRFHGYDVQDARGPIAKVRAYLRQVDRKSEALLAPLAPLEARANTRGMIELTPEQETQTRAAITRLMAAFASKKNAFVARSDSRAYERALRYAQMIAQAQARYAADSPAQSFALRDQAMADNVAWLAEQEGPDATIMVWAHNGHVRLDSEGLLGRNMGSHLRVRFGDDYVAIGFVLGRGEYRAAPDPSRPRETVLTPLNAAGPGDLAEAFARVGQPTFALDLRQTPPGHTRDWLSAPHGLQTCGWIVCEPERLRSVGSITKRYDLVIYTDRTTGAIPLERPTQEGEADDGKP